MIMITGLLALIFISGLPNSEATSPLNSCGDSNPHCPVWARNKHCETNPGWMLKNCIASCGQCGVSTGPCTLATIRAMEHIRGGMMDYPIPDCKPDGTYKEVQCNGMTGCWCVTSEGKVIQGTYVARPKRPNCGSSSIPECKDDNVKCPGWASRGQCKSNPKYMLDKCQMSCRVCSVGPIPPQPGKECKDDNDQCSGWASRGQCKSNPGYMLKKCRMSCLVCSVGPIPPRPGKECKDDNDHCSAWASKGECQKNPNYMRKACRMSCLVCHIGPIPPRPGNEAINEEKDKEKKDEEEPLDKDESEKEEEDEEEDEDQDEKEEEEEDVNKDASEEVGNDVDGSDVYIYNFTGSSGKKSQSDQ